MIQPISGGTPSLPTNIPSKVTNKVSQAVEKQWADLEALLKMTQPVREMILKDLSYEELQAFEISLSKGNAIQKDYKTEFGLLQKQIPHIKQNLILEEILTDHPAWRNSVKSWKGVSLEDKIWLLQIYELCNLGIELPTGNKPSRSTPIFLEADIKAAINSTLDKVKKLNCYLMGLSKCPRAISLLKNLEELDLNDNKLTVPPDVSKNVKLRELWLGENQLSTPPDISKNIHLETFNIRANPLTHQAKEALDKLKIERQNLNIQH